jgi:hypothetical protein
LTPSTLSPASADWIFKYGSTIPALITVPAAGVFDVAGAGAHAAAATTSKIKHRRTGFLRVSSRLRVFVVAFVLVGSPAPSAEGAARL